MSKPIMDLLIIEKGNTINFDANSDYTFEGIFTEFGVRNKNRRIYEKDQFLPHLKELQETITKGKLLGELDHPKDFDVLLGRSSHVIENLDLNENQVLGRIKLLDTAKGRDAKAIADAGVPLHISSRAAGSVNDQGIVEVKKLFTYDLVADPGFANAELSKVAESLNVTESKAQEIQTLITESTTYGADELVLINESLGIDESQGIEVYQIVKKSEDAIKEATEKKEDQLSSKTTDKVTVEQLTKWSNVFVKEVTSLIDNKVSEMNTSDSTKDVQKIQEFLKTFASEVNEKFAEFHSFTNYLSEGMNELVEYNDGVIEQMNSLKEHNNYIVESLNLVKGYSEKAHIDIADLKEHNDHVVESSNKLAEFIDHVAEKANQGINYTENISNGADLLREYTESIAEEVARISESNSAFEEKMNSFQLNERSIKTSKAADKLAKTIDKEQGYEYYEYVLDSYINGQKKQVIEMFKDIADAGLTAEFWKYIKQVSTKQEQAELKKLEAKVNESETSDEEEIDETLTNEGTQYKDALSLKITEALELAKKEQAADINNNNNGKNEFFELLPENYQTQYEALPEDKKQKLMEVSEGIENEEAAITAFDSFTAENKSLNWIDDMPEDVKSIWEGLDSMHQARIKTQSNGYELNTQERIDWFWETRNLRESKQVTIKKAIDNSIQESQETLGYTINVDNIVNSVKNIHG